MYGNYMLKCLFRQVMTVSFWVYTMTQLIGEMVCMCLK